MKRKHVFILITLILLLDQCLKIWIKTSFPTGDTEVSQLSWFRLHFIENPGMAWGLKFWGETGKVMLTLFRLAAVIFGTWYLGKIVRQQHSRGFIICAALIYAGALGNLIDSMFYGVIFDKGLRYAPEINDWVTYSGTASFVQPFHGYAGLFHGSVVDMLHFPIIDTTLPSWVPFAGGEKFQFFSPIFNIADASISIGVIALLVFQKRFFKTKKLDGKHPLVETNSKVSDEVQVS